MEAVIRVRTAYAECMRAMSPMWLDTNCGKVMLYGEKVNAECADTVKWFKDLLEDIGLAIFGSYTAQAHFATTVYADDIRRLTTFNGSVWTELEGVKRV